MSVATSPAPKKARLSKGVSKKCDSFVKKDKEETFRERVQRYYEQTANHLEMPTAKQAKLVQRFIFDEPTLIIHMCKSCRKLSRNRPAINVDDEHQKIEMVLCQICSATFNLQRRVKFFKHDLCCIKQDKEQ